VYASAIIEEEVGPRALRVGSALFCLRARPLAAEVAVMTPLADFVALSLLPSWCWLQTAERLRAGDSPGLIFDAIASACWAHEPERVSALRTRAAAAIRRAEAQHLAPVPWDDASYPLALTTIADPPPVLWMRGVVRSLNAPAVAIVGARAASPHGLSVAERIAADLAANGLVVVSGLARGVDSAAHRGALSVGGATVAVLGSGVDVMYPPEHASLAHEIARSGAVVSELVPGTPPHRRFFPLRNRIISGLSRAVVVIEAGQKSGSLITARAALEQGRDVLAVPGNVLSGRNRGAHGLLRDGAKIVEGADDILEELGMANRAGPRSGRAPSAPRDPILACLTPGEPSDLDAIAEQTGLSPSRLLPRLFELELAGSVARIGGGRFVRVDRTCYGEKKG
jgi:DNA processing protein